MCRHRKTVFFVERKVVETGIRVWSRGVKKYIKNVDNTQMLKKTAWIVSYYLNLLSKEICRSSRDNENFYIVEVNIVSLRVD